MAAMAAAVKLHSLSTHATCTPRAHTRLRFAPWWYEVGWWNLKDFNLTKSDIIPLRYHEGRGVPCLEACRIFIGLRGMPVSIVQCPCPVICTFKATMPADLLSESKWKSRLMIDSSVGKKGGKRAGRGFHGSPSYLAWSLPNLLSCSTVFVKL